MHRFGIVPQRLLREPLRMANKMANKTPAKRGQSPSLPMRWCIGITPGWARCISSGMKTASNSSGCVAEESQSGRELKLDALLVLNCLWQERRCTNTEVAELIQKSETEARTVLHTLVERGLLEGRGEGKGRSYHLSAAVYRRLGAKSAYVAQRGFEPLQQEQMVLQYLATHKRIARRDVSELCKISPNLQVADFQALEERKNRPARPQTRFIL